MAEKKHKPAIELNEMFMARCGSDWSLTFVGEIHRYTNPDGSKYVVGKIPVHEYEIIARASDDVKLGRKLDEMVVSILDYELHKMDSKKLRIAGCDIYLN